MRAQSKPARTTRFIGVFANYSCHFMAFQKNIRGFQAPVFCTAFLWALKQRSRCGKSSAASLYLLLFDLCLFYLVEDLGKPKKSSEIFQLQALEKQSSEQSYEYARNRSRSRQNYHIVAYLSGFKNYHCYDYLTEVMSYRARCADADGG